MTRKPVTLRAESYTKLSAEDLETALLAQGYQETVFSDIEDKRPDKTRVRGKCPFCESPDRSFSYFTERPVWSCTHENKCGRRGNWWTYLRDRGRVQDFSEYVRLLAAAAGVQVPEYDKARYEARKRRASLLEEAQSHYKEQLHAPAGAEVLDYLQQRGYSAEDIEAMALGAYLDKAGLRGHLTGKGYSAQEIEDSGLLKVSPDHKLSIPMEDASGGLVCFGYRALDSRSDKYRYLAGEGYKSGSVTGLNRARSYEKKILVEGLLDGHYVSLKAEQAGHREPIVALGSSNISGEQIKALELTGTREVILALDTDPAGVKGTASTIEKLRGIHGLRVYVAPLASLATPGKKLDPEALVREKGIQAFIDCCNSAESWSRWTAARIIREAGETEDLDADRGQDRLLLSLAEVYIDIGGKLERESFLEPLEATIPDVRELLEAKAEILREDRLAREQKARTDVLIRGLAEARDAGQYGKVEDILSGGLESVRAARTKPPEPYLVADLERDVLTMQDGLTTGFSALDKSVRIPQGAITIVAGRPGQGKTTLQLNLLVNLLKAYRDKSFYFFSYEEAAKALAVKLLMILAGKEISRDTNYGAYVHYLKEKRGGDPDIEAALEELRDWTNSGRLWLADTPLRASELCSAITYLDKRHDTGAVFVDYIQKIRGDLAYPTRQIEIQAVSEQLRETAVSLDIPVILGAQFGRYDKKTKESRAVRLDNLREAGDIEQDANLVLGLHCEAIETAQEEEQNAAADPVVDMSLTALKNRAGVSGLKSHLEFTRPILTLKAYDTSGGWH